jgi:PKHD-type hydroxylase
MLLHVRQVLTAEALAALRRTLASVPWGDGRATSGPQSAQAKNNEQIAQGRPELPGLQQTVLAALSRHPLFLSAALPRRILPPMFNRYVGATTRSATTSTARSATSRARPASASAPTSAARYLLRLWADV